MNQEEAIKLSESEWWKNSTNEEIAEFQLKEERLCLPFEILHKAVETWLGRPVFTHEFADTQALIDEKEGRRQYDGVVGSLRRVAPGKPIFLGTEEGIYEVEDENS